jgi:hypothetical protein
MNGEEVVFVGGSDVQSLFLTLSLNLVRTPYSKYRTGRLPVGKVVLEWALPPNDKIPVFDLPIRRGGAEEQACRGCLSVPGSQWSEFRFLS